MLMFAQETQAARPVPPAKMKAVEELEELESVEHADTSVYPGSVIRDDGGRYDGDLRMGRFHGHGSFLWPNGELYVGQWKAGSRHGVGTHVWPNYKYYVGTHKLSLPVTLWASVLFCLGFISIIMHVCVSTWYASFCSVELPVAMCVCNDQCFAFVFYWTGEWSLSAMHGPGVMVYADGRPREEGVWKDGTLTRAGPVSDLSCVAAANNYNSPLARDGNVANADQCLIA
jgi:hypothetical protein